MATDHPYSNVRLDDPENDHDDSSVTEVEESLIDSSEKHWNHNGIYRRPTPKSKTRKCLSFVSSARWVIDTLLLLVIVGLLVRDEFWRKEELRLWKSGAGVPVTSETEVGGDVTGIRPHFSTQVTRFQINQTFAPYNTSEFFRDEVLDAWNALMPVGMGFQWVNDTHKYHDLPTPIIWPNKTVFTTSMTHQLHCLFAVVQTYSGLKSNTTLPEDHHWHMIHCFDYMRQAIMCSADMALEGLETTFPDHNGGSDGWDSKHVCRDYGQVIDYLEANRAYDDQQIY